MKERVRMGKILQLLAIIPVYILSLKGGLAERIWEENVLSITVAANKIS